MCQTPASIFRCLQSGERVWPAPVAAQACVVIIGRVLSRFIIWPISVVCLIVRGLIPQAYFTEQSTWRGLRLIELLPPSPYTCRAFDPRLVAYRYCRTGPSQHHIERFCPFQRDHCAVTLRQSSCNVFADPHLTQSHPWTTINLIMREIRDNGNMTVLRKPITKSMYPVNTAYPVTNQKALFVDSSYSQSIVAWDDEESGQH